MIRNKDVQRWHAKLAGDLNGLSQLVGPASRDLMVLSQVTVPASRDVFEKAQVALENVAKEVERRLLM